MPSVIRGSDGFDSAGGNAVKAWVNFNGTGTVAIRASFNVSSITDLGTGSYQVNFTNSMTDSNYSAVCQAQQNTTTAQFTRLGALSTSSIVVDDLSAAGTFYDPVVMCVAIFR